MDHQWVEEIAGVLSAGNNRAIVVSCRHSPGNSPFAASRQGAELTTILCFLSLLLFLAFSRTAAGADGVQSRQSGPLGDAHIRLLTPLSSIGSRCGSEFQAVVIAPFQRLGRVLMPQGTVVSGKVTSRKSVGMGFVHERASLRIVFREYAFADGRRFPLQARLKSIENGREEVTTHGEIRGVLAANSPQQVIGGLWTRPTLTLFEQPLDRTGILGPIGAAGLFALKVALFRMPEPDIQLPVGAERRFDGARGTERCPGFRPPGTYGSTD